MCACRTGQRSAPAKTSRIDRPYGQKSSRSPASHFAITAQIADWQPSFLVRPLTAYDASLRGSFTFPDPFLGA
jgi:hypothetical protein